MSLADPKPAELVTSLMPPARSAKPRRRHFLLWIAFLVGVVGPILGAGWYLYHVAADQYGSTVGFSIIKEEFTSPIELIGGIADVASSGSSDSDILYEFIQSQEMVAILEEQLTLSEIYSRPAEDPVFAFDPGGTIEDLQAYWHRMVKITYDSSTQLIEVRALAFSPEEAQQITSAIFAQSARLIDELSAIAQSDAIAFAEEELARAIERLKAAREAMTEYRSRTQIVDPSADVQGQMGLLSTLEQQLAEAMISADLLRESTRAGDPRITQADLRISIIENRIEEERRKLGVGGAGEAGEDYATLLAEYERLLVDREFAEAAYTAALATYDQALAEARRKSRYLAAYIKPTLAEASEFPKRVTLLATLAALLLGVWAMSALIFYSLRDRR